MRRAVIYNYNYAPIAVPLSQRWDKHLSQVFNEFGVLYIALLELGTRQEATNRERSTNTPGLPSSHVF
jgi:hypothetical protein